MKYSRQIIPAAGLVGTITIAAYMVVQLDSQTQHATADFTNAKIGEVRDAHGAVLLRGQFAAVAEEDDDVERKAPLQATGVDPDAAGEAEIEHSKASPAEQEVEFSVRNLQPGSTVTFVIDGTEVGTATVDRRGRAEVEVDIRLPGAAAR
jgi:hypothetical protein